MKLATLILIAAVAMSSTSYGACPRTGNGLFKNTAATSSNIAAKTQASVKVASTKAVR